MEQCERCIGFVEDFLQNPQHPIEELHKRERPKRVRQCSRDIAKTLLRILVYTPLSLYEELETYDRFVNGERKINPGKITEDDLKWLYHRCVRFYYKFRMQYRQHNPHFDFILILLQEHMILSKCYDKYYYEQWLAQKFIFLLQNLKQIHREHGGIERPNVEKASIRVSIPTAPSHWYDLYD